MSATDVLAISRKASRQTILSIVLGVVALGVFVFVWHVLTVNRINFYVRFINVPTPGSVAQRALSSIGNPQFVDHIVISTRRVAIGFSLATILAVPLGLSMGRFRSLRDILLPLFEVLRPIPAIAWVPMSIMLWPKSEESIVFITFLGSFFPILINTLHGVSSVDPILVRAARSLGAGQWTQFVEIFLPAALPNIFTGLTVGMGVAWVSLIAAEMISGQFGIGYFTWESYALIQYPDIVLGMLLIGVLGLVSSGVIRLLGVLVMPWQGNKGARVR